MRNRSFVISFFAAILALVSCSNGGSYRWPKGETNSMKDNLHGYVFPSFVEGKTEIRVDESVNYGSAESPLYRVILEAKDCADLNSLNRYLHILEDDDFVIAKASSRYPGAPKGSIYDLRRKVDDTHYIAATAYIYEERNVAPEGETPVYEMFYNDTGSFRLVAADSYLYEWPTEDIDQLVNLFSYRYSQGETVDYYLPVCEGGFFELGSHAIYCYSKEDNPRKMMSDYIDTLRDQYWFFEYLPDDKAYRLMPPDEDYILYVYYEESYQRVVLDLSAKEVDGPSDVSYQSDSWDTALYDIFFSPYSLDPVDVPVPVVGEDSRFTYYEDSNNVDYFYSHDLEQMAIYVEIDHFTAEDYFRYITGLVYSYGWVIDEETISFLHKIEGGQRVRIKVDHDAENSLLTMKIYMAPFYIRYYEWPTNLIRENLIEYNSSFTDTLPAFTGSLTCILAYENMVILYAEDAQMAAEMYASTLQSSGFTMDFVDEYTSPHEQYIVTISWDFERVEICITGVEEKPETMFDHFPSEVLSDALGDLAYLIPPIEGGIRYELIIFTGSEEGPNGNSSVWFDESVSFSDIEEMVEDYIAVLLGMGYTPFGEDEYGYISSGNDMWLYVQAENYDDGPIFALYFDTNMDHFLE